MQRTFAYAVLGGLFTLAMAGFAIGSGTLCTPTTLDAPAAHAEAVAGFEPDLALVEPAAVPLDQPVDSHACVGQIRPGAQQSNGCTLSWIFRDQSGALYQSTAGHCTSSVGQRIGATGVGTFGTVVWRVNGGVGNDMALIRIDPAMYGLVNPTLCHWGGPTGIATPDEATTDTAKVNGMLHYGWGVYFRGTSVERARAGVLPGPDNAVDGAGWFPDGSVRMRGFTDGGDSGSPMMLASGLAVGVHTHRLHAQNGLLYLAYFGNKAATRLDMMLPRVEAGLGLDLDIVPGMPVDLVLP